MDVQTLIRALDSLLPHIMASDAAWCKEKLREAGRRMHRGQPVDRLLKKLVQRAESSRLKAEDRQKRLPSPDYDSALPITASRETIIERMVQSPVLIVAGETGSGKTTQLPKMCLQAGRGIRGQVACTQPRRIAARAMAERVAEELGEELGQSVGYQVRFRERSSADGFIKFMTDGILLAESMRDPLLSAYDTIIIDEAHERSLNIDFLLGYLKRLVVRRPDLRVIVTSATIDTGRFAAHFDNAPVVEVSGRGYPVDVIYQPLSEDDEGSSHDGRDLYQGIADAIRRLNRIDPQGDVLVFLSGEREIREAGDFLARQNLGARAVGNEILPLYARLSSAEQRRVFHPGSARRIILSTNVAETSLTVPRIRFVIDSGLARISRYAHRSRIQRLPIEAISQASADQRKGRCGRIAPGTCVRLYSEADFLNRPEFTEPEILRTSLATVILRMLTMGLGEVERFPFIDPPAPRMINDAYQLLLELQAIDDERQPTALGRKLAAWPMDARLARMVEEGARRNCLEDVLVLAAAISIQDPRERPLDSQAAADEQHDRFSDDQSDFIGFLNLWRYLRKLRHEVSGNQFRKRCRREFLNWQRVLEWFDLYQQLRDQARETRLPLSGKPGSPEAIHRALLAGQLSHVGVRHPEDASYSGCRGRQFWIFPGSGLFGRGPKWLMSAEIVETSRPYARTNAVIKAEWIEEQAAHLLRRRVFDPHWSRRRGAVMAWEQLSLYGLVLVEKRRVRFAPHDPREARRLFIEHALVRGELDSRASFIRHNQRVRDEVERLEHKRRRKDVVVDERAQFEFFDARVPDDVNSARSLAQWLDGLSPADREQLHMSHDVLMRDDAGKAPEAQFPDRLEINGQTFALSYHFEPGAAADGVTLDIPLEQLNILQPERMQWLVPGLLREKLVELMRQLPKPLRRSLTPIPSFADALMESVPGELDRSMLDWLRDGVLRLTGLQVEDGLLDEGALADHLRFRFRVLGAQGQCIEEGRDLEAIQQRLGQRARRQFMDRQGLDHVLDGQLRWVFGDLTAPVRTRRGLSAWRALVDQENAVGLRLFETRPEADQAHAAGVTRLVSIALSDKLNYLLKNHGLSREAQLAWMPVGQPSALVRDLAWRALTDLCESAVAVRDEAAFEKLCRRVRAELVPQAQKSAEHLNAFLPAFRRVNTQLEGDIASVFPDACDDMHTQLADLVYEGFLMDLWPGRLQHYPRYFQALEIRLQQLDIDPARDRQRMQAVAPWWRKYLEALERGVPFDDDMDRYRWLVEEYRVSLFAQSLGAREKVSPERLREAWAGIG